jgi:hypothetical protein
MATSNYDHALSTCYIFSHQTKILPKSVSHVMYVKNSSTMQPTHKFDTFSSYVLMEVTVM